LLYAGFLATRAKSWGEYAATADGVGLRRNYALSLLTGLLWYLQFFFYGLGHVRMGSFEFSSWAIHMIILILLSCGFGIAIASGKRAARRQSGSSLARSGCCSVRVALITYGKQASRPRTPDDPRDEPAASDGFASPPCVWTVRVSDSQYSGNVLRPRRLHAPRSMPGRSICRTDDTLLHRRAWPAASGTPPSSTPTGSPKRTRRRPARSRTDAPPRAAARIFQMAGRVASAAPGLRR